MSRRGSVRSLRSGAGGEHQHPEERGGEHEADREQRPHRGALLVGELAEDPHGAEGDRGGQADEGTDAHGRILRAPKRQERFGLLTYIR